VVVVCHLAYSGLFKKFLMLPQKAQKANNSKI
jgi:hypothetical protein